MNSLTIKFTRYYFDNDNILTEKEDVTISMTIPVNQKKLYFIGVRKYVEIDGVQQEYNDSVWQALKTFDIQDDMTRLPSICCFRKQYNVTLK